MPNHGDVHRSCNISTASQLNKFELDRQENVFNTKVNIDLKNMGCWLGIAKLPLDELNIYGSKTSEIKHNIRVRIKDLGSDSENDTSVWTESKSSSSNSDFECNNKTKNIGRGQTIKNKKMFSESWVVPKKIEHFEHKRTPDDTCTQIDSEK